jgi:hypothetical protein
VTFLFKFVSVYVVAYDRFPFCWYEAAGYESHYRHDNWGLCPRRLSPSCSIEFPVPKRHDAFAAPPELTEGREGCRLLRTESLKYTDLPDGLKM